MTGDDAASLTALLRDYGQFWAINRTPEGVRAQQRNSPAPPAVFTAPTVAALRELLEHGYDPAELAAINRDYGGDCQVEHIDPGSAWVALYYCDDGLIGVIAANDLESLRRKLSLGRNPNEVTGERTTSITPGPDS